MRSTIRVRLAAWHTGVLAVFLAGFAIAAYRYAASSGAGRMDQFLAETGGAVADAVLTERARGRAATAAIRTVAADFRFRDLAIAVLDGRGRPVAGTPLDTVLGWHRAALAGAANREGGRSQTIPGRTARYRTFATPVQLDGRTYVVVVAQSLAPLERQLSEARMTLLLAVPVALVLSAAGGYLLARRSLAPVVSMSEHAERITATRLHERLAVANASDELGMLAGVFNGMLDRLERAFEQQRAFIAMASHELRTPVATVRAEADVALAGGERAAEDYRAALALIRDEGRRLSRIVDDLLLLARADAQQLPLRPARFDLYELAVDCVRAMRALATGAGVELRCADPTMDELPFEGDEHLLRQVLRNLLDNAIRYTPPCGRVDVSAAKGDGEYRLVVTDTGCGIAPASQPRIFERFYRADPPDGRGPASRGGGAEGGEGGGGAGLGLAIAQWAAEAHGGRVELTRSDAAGSVFTVVLPLAGDVR